MLHSAVIMLLIDLTVPDRLPMQLQFLIFVYNLALLHWFFCRLEQSTKKFAFIRTVLWGKLFSNAIIVDAVMFSFLDSFLPKLKVLLFYFVGSPVWASMLWRTWTGTWVSGVLWLMTDASCSGLLRSVFLIFFLKIPIKSNSWRACSRSVPYRSLQSRSSWGHARSVHNK